MASVPVPNTVEVEIRMGLAAQKIENTLYFFNANGPTIANVTTLLDDVIDWWGTYMAPLYPIDVSLTELVGTDLTTATGLQVTRIPLTPNLGTVGSPALPNNVTLAVSFRTAIRGRSYRGRNYVAALAENQVEQSTVSLSHADALQAAYNAILTAVAPPASDWVWCVVSRYQGVDSEGKPIPRVVGNPEPITTAVVVDRIVDSQRRRLPGRGQ